MSVDVYPARRDKSAGNVERLAGEFAIEPRTHGDDAPVLNGDVAYAVDSALGVENATASK
jgi:hypothetical protein